MNDDKPISLLPRLEVTRREALRLFGAGMIALQAACLERPGEEIRPAVRRSEASPGTPRFYATSMVIDGFATGLLVESNGGRPTKIEGNPLHPASAGATLAAHQASILDLYDPHRVRAPQAGGLPGTWTKFRATIDRLPDGELWLVLPPDGSPTIAALLDRIRERHPRLAIVQHAAIDRGNAYRGTQLAFGAPLELQLAFDRADAVVSFDADFLAAMPMSVRWSRDFATRRRDVEAGQRPVQLFVAEPMLTPTGSLADHRLARSAGDMTALAIGLVDALAQRGVRGAGSPPQAVVAAARARIADDAKRWLALAADALVRHRGASVVIAGDRVSPQAQALLHRTVLALGSVGRTTSYTTPALALPHDGPTLAQLAAAIRDGRVGAVLALDTDPVYSAPPGLELAKRIAEVPLSVHATLHPSATSASCGWVVPLSHYLESWGDARAWDGTASPIQPLIRPLHDSRSRLEILAMLAGETLLDDRALVRAQWQDLVDPAWHATLADGVIDGTAAPARTVAPAGSEFLADLALAPDTPIEIDLAPSPSILDGRFATNPWLQELPHPLTKLTWGNAAYVSHTTARQLDVRDGDVLRIQSEGRTIELPAVVAHGHAERCITIEVGYGQQTTPIANGIGANGFVLGAPVAYRASVRKTGKQVRLARTQEHFDDQGREIAFATTLAAYRANPDFTATHRGPLVTMLESRDPPPEVPQWTMTIDTTICSGCSSCVIACQAENNVPVVGPDGVRRAREMHWLRIDTYVTGDNVVHQPMLCQHCEHAPCEYVCPVNATVHSPDGLNEMVYNRCVGTRFCSNNCPYKVRRFNYFGYAKHDLTALQKNPEVTVRGRGVMEKCTFCVQRIRGAEIVARMANRPIPPGEVVTACQQACPTGAIQFAARQHTETPAVQWGRVPRAYHVLHELGTRPRVTYLAKIFDPGDLE